MNVRPYTPSDWPRICAIHDTARRHELQARLLGDAFLSLEQTAENEGLFAASGYVLKRTASDA